MTQDQTPATPDPDPAFVPAIAFPNVTDSREVRGYFSHAEIIPPKPAKGGKDATPERVAIIGIAAATGAAQSSVRASNRTAASGSVVLRDDETREFLAVVGRENLPDWNAAMAHTAGAPMRVLAFGSAGVTLSEAELLALLA